jgi:hypothetical protein
MHLAYTIMDVSYAHIEWIIFILASCYRHCHLVAPEDNRYKHRPMHCWVLGNFILWHHIQLSDTKVKKLNNVLLASMPMNQT